MSEPPGATAKENPLVGHQVSPLRGLPPPHCHAGPPLQAPGPLPHLPEQGPQAPRGEQAVLCGASSRRGSQGSGGDFHLLKSSEVLLASGLLMDPSKVAWK
eukprot:5257236-Lingulodinium_polyedra.AAC.1